MRILLSFPPTSKNRIGFRQQMKRPYLHALQAATEYCLVAVWCSALVFSVFAAGPHGRERLSANLFWALANSTIFTLAGAAFFFAAWGLHRSGTPLLVIRILCGIATPVVGVLLTRRSLFFLLNQPGYYYLGPMIFLADFVLFALIYGAWLLPRHFKPGAVPRLHVHWAVLALMVPYVPALILHTVTGFPQQVFSMGRSKAPRPCEVIYARLTPAADGLVVEPFDMHLPPSRGGLIPEPESPGAGYVNLHDDEIQTLRSAGIAGNIKVLGGVTSSVHRGRLVLIMSQQLDSPFEFAEPGDANVIYVQTAEGWRKLPPDAGESKTHVRLYVPEGKPNVTGIEVDTEDSHRYQDETRYQWQ